MSFIRFHGNFELAKTGYGRPTSEAERRVAFRVHAARQLASHARQLDLARLFGGPKAASLSLSPILPCSLFPLLRSGRAESSRSHAPIL